MNILEEKIIKWNNRRLKLEKQAKELEKSLLYKDPNAHFDLGKIAVIMTLSARAEEIHICITELEEIETELFPKSH
ncbi:MAG: hypothetical protein ACFFDN_13625 [Candidatus Hodarchaeota archaeon]